MGDLPCYVYYPAKKSAKETRNRCRLNGNSLLKGNSSILPVGIEGSRSGSRISNEQDSVYRLYRFICV